MRSRPTFSAALLLVATWLLGPAACTDSAEAPAAGPAVVVHGVAAHDGNAQAAIPKPSTYVYSFAGKRDPFRSYLAEVHEREDEARRDHAREPTEEFDTSQFRLTAIVSGGPTPSAMVEDPLGRGHILRIGSRIGRNNGRITNIDTTGLNIVEQFFDGTGKLLEVSSVLRLPTGDDSALGRP